MAKLPNPPKSKRLTKKVGLECLAILNEIDRVLFDSRILEMPCLWDRMREATRTEDPDRWVQEMHDRVIAACANLWAWKDEEFKCTNALRRERYATKYVGVVDEEGDTRYYPRYKLNPKLKKNIPGMKCKEE